MGTGKHHIFTIIDIICSNNIFHIIHIKYITDIIHIIDIIHSKYINPPHPRFEGARRQRVRRSR